MKKIWRKFLNKIISEDIDVQHKLLNIILCAIFIGGSFSFLVSIFIDINIWGELSVFLMLTVVTICLYISAWSRKPKLAAIIAISSANLLVFPLMYFSSGGLFSGMPIWFILGLIFTWLVLSGPICFIMYLLSGSVMILCMVFEYFNPDMVVKLTRLGMLLDVIQSLMSVSFMFGLIFKYETHLYESQKGHMLKQDEKQKAILEDLNKANQAKSDFLANMSHEIRTPINAVLGMDEMILRQELPDDVREYAEKIQSAGHSLLSIINDILDFSKIESGKMEIIPVEYEVTSLISDCYNMVSMRALDKGLKLKVVNVKNLPKTLLGDEVRIRQIITNLLTNAVKYTEKGEVILRFDCIPVDGKRIYLVVSVEDTGVGISQENQAMLFKSFQRIEEKKNRNIEGTGLGLTITKQLVDMMGGRIKVQSQLGVGSTFSVEIPQTIIDNSPIGDFSNNYHGVNHSTTYKERFYAPKAKILAVDDVKMNLDVLIGLLSKTRISIDTALGGKEAIEKLQNVKYDLVFLDHMMPEISGIEVLRHVKASGGVNIDTPMVVLTANAIIGAEQQYMEEGFDGYITKPVKSSELEDIVMKFVPEDKIIIVDSKENSDAESATEKTATKKSMKDILESVGIDMVLGLTYCAEDEELYTEMLKEFLSDDKRQSLNEFLAEDNYKDYIIKIHGLKSSALTIGARELSEEAKKLEFAGKDGDYEFIKNNHDVAMDMYEKVLEALKMLE